MTVEGSNVPIPSPSATAVELLYEGAPDIDLAEVARRAAARGTAPAEPAATIGVAFPDLKVRFSEGAIPLTVSVMAFGEGRDRQPGWIDKALQQTWSWKRELAGEAARRGTHVVLVADLMAGPLDRRLRLPAYHVVLASLVELTRPIAMHWLQGERFLEPSAYLADADADPNAFQSTVNVRYVTFSDQPGQQLMDTVGLAPFLIPDVQMHFVSLEPGWVAGKLLGIARYLFDNGDIIEDGNTVPGRTDNEKWRCRHEEPMLGPARVVLDINPYPYGPKR